MEGEGGNPFIFFPKAPVVHPLLRRMTTYALARRLRFTIEDQALRAPRVASRKKINRFFI